MFFREGDRAIFAYGFAKNNQDNLDEDDERDLKKAAKLTLGFTQAEIDKLVERGTLVEVDCDDEDDAAQNLPE